jgi:hypothetical protein
MLYSYFPQSTNNITNRSKGGATILPVIDRTSEFKHFEYTGQNQQNKIQQDFQGSLGGSEMKNPTSAAILGSNHIAVDILNVSGEGEFEQFINLRKKAKECLSRMSSLTSSVENLHRQSLLAANIEESNRIAVSIDAQVAEYQTTITQLR